MASGGGEQMLSDSKDLVELLARLQETLTKATNKNDNLLEAIESSEAKATQTGSGEAPLLRNLRARLATAHAPNSALRRELASFAGVFEKRHKDLESCILNTEEIRRQVKQDQYDLEVRIRRYGQERTEFEQERAEWKDELDRERQGLIEQNDRLAVLSQELSGTKVELDAKKSELACQRIAFEEEKLARLDNDGHAADSEAEALRLKLKEQVLHNVQLENALLHIELSLHQKEEVYKEMEKRNKRLEHDNLQSKLASSKAVKQFEKRTSEANKKLAQMNSELFKAQEHARRFQDLLSSERRKQKGLQHALEQELQRKSTSGGHGDVITPAAQKAYIDTLSETLAVPNKPHNPARVGEVVRKSEAMLVENASLKAEIRRLRIDNADLLKRVRFADNNAHYMRNQVVTNVSDRAELLRRLDHAEAKYRQLESSLTKQASDWVKLREKETKTEKTVKWSQIEPIPLLGASERTWNSQPSQKSQSQSRAIQVHRW